MLFLNFHLPLTFISPLLLSRPQFFFRTADVTGTCMLPATVEMVSCSTTPQHVMNSISFGFYGMLLHCDHASSADNGLLFFTAQVVPGDNATLTIELICPVPMADGLRFALREGGKTVGAGVVSKVIE